MIDNESWSPIKITLSHSPFPQPCRSSPSWPVLIDSFGETTAATPEWTRLIIQKIQCKKRVFIVVSYPWHKIRQRHKTVTKNNGTLKQSNWHMHRFIFWWLMPHISSAELQCLMINSHHITLFSRLNPHFLGPNPIPPNYPSPLPSANQTWHLSIPCKWKFIAGKIILLRDCPNTASLTKGSPHHHHCWVSSPSIPCGKFHKSYPKIDGLFNRTSVDMVHGESSNGWFLGVCRVPPEGNLRKLEESSIWSPHLQVVIPGALWRSALVT